MRDFVQSPASRRFRTPMILRPIALGGSALLRLTTKALRPPKSPGLRTVDRMTTDQLSQQLGMTVLTGHPDQKALKPHLQEVAQNWRDHDWGRIGQRLSRLDRAHAALPSGDRMAPAIGRALFRHLAGPQVCAMIDRGQSVSPDDLPDALMAPLLRVLQQLQIDPTLHFLTAQFQLEMGWARHGDDYADFALDGALTAAEEHFRAASAILDRIAPRAPHSGYYAELDYRTIAANGTTMDELNRAALRWSRADPASLVPYATHGLHLLPRWYGEPTSLQDYADRSWTKTHEKLGAAAYSAIYLAAIENDLEAALTLNMQVFREGLIDMMEECDDPDLTCNAILRTLWTISAEPYTDGGREPKALRDIRHRMRALFCDLARTTLGPVMPDVWGGRWTEAKIMHALAEAFAAEIAAGKAVAIGLDGAQILD
ncbi:hypothetical protein [Pseudooceanicola sp. MF1-13]|uniref:hypothetical protein n=1 Tax=Pseudooceanicola sp. MF1-13 TaxID=3379095 RepID=UPI0038927B97